MTARRVLWILLLLLLPIDMGKAHSDPQAHWTLLYFMNADCHDGDSAVTPMLDELMRVGGSAQVEVLVYIDRGNNPCPVGNLPTWQAGKLFRVLPGQLVEIAAAPPGVGPPSNTNGAVPQDPNLGDVNTLAWFLETGLSLAPSEKVALFTVGHGAPWRGLGADETPNDRLDFREFSEALARVLGPPQRRLSVLGLIHCGVSCMEAVLPLAPWAEWMLASEDVTTSFAIPPAEFLHQVRGSLGAEELARLCLRMYQLSPRYGAASAAGLALIDSRHAQAAGEALDRLATTLTSLLASGDAQTLAELRMAKLRARHLGCCADQGCDPGNCQICLCCMVDLLQVALRLTHSRNPIVAADARCLVCQMRNLVPQRRHAVGLGSAGGVSVFLPCRSQDVADYWQSTLSSDHAWGALLDTFLRQPCQTCGSSGEAMSPAIYRTSSEPYPGQASGLSSRVKVEVDSDAILVSEQEAWLTVSLAPGALPQLMIPATVEPGAAGYRLAATWDWALPCLETDDPEAFVPVAVRYPRPRDEDETELAAEVPMLYWPRGGGVEHVREAVVTLVLGDSAGNDSLGWVRGLRRGRGSGVFAPIDLQQGDALLPTGTVFPGKGAKVEGEALAAPPAVISLPPRLVARRLPNGAHVWLGFTVLTADGTYADIRIPKPYAANAHPAVPLTLK